MNVNMRDPLMLLFMAFMVEVALPLVQGQVSGISAKDDIISSAMFPSSYGNDIEATHSISVLPRHYLSISFIEFYLEYESNCGYDSLKIVDTSGKDLFFGCGQMHGLSVPAAENFPSLIETSLGVTITFKTDGSVTQKGFQLKVQQLGSTLMFLGPGFVNGYGASAKSEVFLTNSDLTRATCTVPEYPIGVSNYVGFIYEDLLHICGGYVSSLYRSACFSLKDSTWSPTTPLLSEKYDATAVRMNNGSVLVSGGVSGSSMLQSSELLTGSTWTPAIQLPSPRAGHCMLLLESGALFLQGGMSDSGHRVSDTYISQDHTSWEKIWYSGTRRMHHACTEVTINTKQQVWVGGGDATSDTTIFHLVDGTWTWTAGPDLPNYTGTWYGGEGGQFVSNNGKLVYAGGKDNKNIYQLKDGWTQDNAWTKIGEMSETRQYFTALMITEDMCKGEKPEAPIFDPKITQSDYNTCVNGSCAYVGGDRASTFADLLSNSNEIIEVECCNSGGIINDTIRTCGNGISCSTICEQDTGNTYFSGCLTIKANNETESSKTCSSSMDTENWCQQTEVIDELAGKTVQSGGKRKKRNGLLHALPIYRLWYCPQRVRTVGSLARYPECCLHPAVRQRIHRIKEKCCKGYSVCV